jgi:hypothetical protein
MDTRASPQNWGGKAQNCRDGSALPANSWQTAN